MSTRRFLGAVAAVLLLGLAPAAPAASPHVSVSLRGVTADTLEQGEPWRVAVRLDVPRGGKESFVLAPAGGSWADALSVELISAAGASVAVRAEPLGKPDAATATLDARHVAGGLWRISPEAMQAVAPGNYVLRVQLKIAQGSGWTGTAKAREIPLKVLAPAATTSVPRIVNRAQDALLLDKIQEAAALVDAVLKITPRDPALLRVRAEIAERAGNPLAATICLNAAIFSVSKKRSGPPPTEDLDMSARLSKARKAAVASTTPPAWSWPPTEVLTALAQDAQKAAFVPASPADRPAGARNETVPTPLTVPTTSPMIPAASVPVIQSAPTAPVIEPGVVVPASELVETDILADAKGQWASSAVAGSQYSSPNYAAVQATGVPNVPIVGDSPLAWCPARQGGSPEWLELTFTKPVPATEVRIRQSNLPGTIAKLEVVDTEGRVHPWWAGEDAQKPAANQILWFAVRVPVRTAYVVAKVKITLNLDARPGWKQIDAVQLVGTAP